MIKMKFIKIIIAILVIGGAFVFLDKEYKGAVNDCMAAGNTKTYCEYHAAN
jgi:uncharacterized ion transporter superfamily protein YfcC